MTEEPFEEQEVPEVPDVPEVPKAPVITEDGAFVVPERTDKGKKNNNRTLWIILIIIAVLILLCCCASVVLLVIGVFRGFDWIFDLLRDMWSSINPFLAMMAS